MRNAIKATQLNTLRTIEFNIFQIDLRIEILELIFNANLTISIQLATSTHRKSRVIFLYQWQW